MTDSIQDFHIERLKAATINKLSMSDLPEWVCKHTYVDGANYSFKDHEFQERILRETAQETVIRKCAQVGMSETSLRLALALVGVIPHYTVIYTLPTASFATTFMRTRVDPVIQSSPFLRESVHGTTDNADVKRFGDSFLYMKGSQSNNAPISVPADHLIHDELDFSSEEVISQYQSRVRHSKYRRKTKLSTPTAPGFGIDEEFSQSRRHFNFVKCNHCNHFFIPDYYKHVVIPGYSGDILNITKSMLPGLRWREAHVMCPACDRTPSLQPEHREWVCENASENHVAVGYQVSPFDAPNVTSTAYLVEESTKYKKRSDFDNFGLGIPSEDKESTITREDLLRILLAPQSIGASSYVMGLDMGLTCWATIMAVRPDSTRIVVRTEGIPVGEVRQRRKELAFQYKVRMTVVDALPYTETVMAMQDEDNNLFGAVYIQSKSLATHNVVDKEEDEDKAQLSIRQVNINRNKAFDSIMDDVRAGHILKVSDENDEIWMEHLQDMKRLKEYTRDDELTYVWKKTKGNDHLHHSLLYASTAAQMLGVSRNMIQLPILMGKFRSKSGV